MGRTTLPCGTRRGRGRVRVLDEPIGGIGRYRVQLVDPPVAGERGERVDGLGVGEVAELDLERDVAGGRADVRVGGRLHVLDQIAAVVHFSDDAVGPMMVISADHESAIEADNPLPLHACCRPQIPATEGS